MIQYSLTWFCCMALLFIGYAQQDEGPGNDSLNETSTLYSTQDHQLVLENTTTGEVDRIRSKLIKIAYKGKKIKGKVTMISNDRLILNGTAYNYSDINFIQAGISPIRTSIGFIIAAGGAALGVISATAFEYDSFALPVGIFTVGVSLMLFPNRKYCLENSNQEYSREKCKSGDWKISVEPIRAARASAGKS